LNLIPPSSQFYGRFFQPINISSTTSSSMVLGVIAPFLFLWALPLVLALDPQVPTTCYSLNGAKRIQSGFRCDNSTTGHSTCCDPGAICYSNGVCQQSNGPVQDYLRVGCTDKTWKDPACLEQCKTCKFIHLQPHMGINIDS
jgi:hypothetical protein